MVRFHPIPPYMVCQFIGQNVALSRLRDEFDSRTDRQAIAARVKAQADFEVAQLEADAIAYKGQKEAEATQALAAAITEEIVAYEYAQNWSGNLPQYMMGANGALPIIDIPMGEE